jgi:hypothetical protein
MKLKRLLFENEEQEGEILEFIALDLLKDEIESGERHIVCFFIREHSFFSSLVSIWSSIFNRFF